MSFENFSANVIIILLSSAKKTKNTINGHGPFIWTVLLRVIQIVSVWTNPLAELVAPH